MPRTCSKILIKEYNHTFCDRCGEWFRKGGKCQKICLKCVEKKRKEMWEVRRSNGRKRILNSSL